MKLRYRILAMLAAAIAGILLVSFMGLQALRNSMLEERQEQIMKAVQLCRGILERYHAQEASGKLSREEAQAKAKDAISGLRFKDDYIFVRTLDNVMLVHADASRVGKVDKGSKTPDGRLTGDIYKEELAKSDRVFMTAFIARPQDADKKPVPKLLGAVLYEPWNWVIGNGVFIDDFDSAFWKQAYRYLAVGTVLLFLLGAWGLLLARSVQRQLGGEPRYAADIANQIATGNLHCAIEVNGPPESLLASMQRMQASLRDIVLHVRDGSEAIQTATSEVANGNQDLSNRTEQAAANLEETTASIQQLTENVRQTADAATQANDMAHQAASEAGRGGEVVSQVISTMGEISASSRKINDIIGVIDGIAFQTNILALNAAVEAARAGEQGRGFAVVAGEVRTLAQRSAQAAREIKDLISASVAGVENGSALVEKAGATMKDIVNAVQRVSVIISEISAATRQQSTNITEIGNAVVHLDQMTQQNAALVEQGSAAAASLKEQAVGLRSCLKKYQMEPISEVHQPPRRRKRCTPPT